MTIFVRLTLRWAKVKLNPGFAIHNANAACITSKNLNAE